MTDDVRRGEVFEIEPSERRGAFFHLPWWLIAMAAFAVAELTAHPSIGVIVLCLKFGWNDFLTALWLRRRDPERKRGKICSWFYFASGLWRVCMWSFLLLFMTLAFSVMVELKQAQAGAPGNDPMIEAITCLIVWLVSSAFATLYSLLAIIFAWRDKTKIWVSGSLSDSRRSGDWPPRPNSRGRNVLRWWLITMGAMLFTTMFGCCLGMLANVMGNFGPAAGVVVALLAVLSPILLALTILTICNRIYARVGAMAPADCWPELLEFGYFTSTELRRQSWGLPAQIDSLPSARTTEPE